MKQRNLKDCAICCLSMALGVSYKKIKDDVMSANKIMYGDRHKFDGTTIEVEHLILWKYGINHDFIEKKWVCSLSNGLLQKMPPFRRKIRNKRALLTVPSLNFNGKYHAVYWDGRKIHDPSNLRCYDTASALSAVVAITILRD